MLTAEQIKSLKDDNVSKDTQESKRRVKEDFLPAPIVVKDNIIYLSSLPRPLMYEAIRTGQVSAKTVLALAQVFHVTPYYYTGETSDKLPLDKDTLLSFLLEHGYTILYEEQKDEDEEKYNYNSFYSFLTNYEIDLAERQHLENLNLMDTSFWEKQYDGDVATIRLKLPNSYDLHEHITMLTEDETTNLLKSLYTRGKSERRAGMVLELVQWLLML